MGECAFDWNSELGACPWEECCMDERKTMNEPPGGYILTCRTCGEVKTLPSVPDVAAWYLIHSVKKHWDSLELLRDADDETLASAIGLAAGKGWLGRIGNV